MSQLPDRPDDAIDAADARWIFEPEAVAQLLAEWQFSPEVAAHLEKRARELALSPANRASFLTVANRWISDPDPELSKSVDPEIAPLVALAGFRKMLQRHRARQIPFEVTAATARDLDRRMLELRGKTDPWGFDRLPWMANHIGRDLLEIGRLQYLPARYGAPYRVFAHRSDPGRVFAFPEEGLACSESGWLDKDADGPGAFRTSFTLTASEISGHPVDFTSGRILRDPVTLPAGEFDLRLSRDSEVLHVHIPSGAPLTREACLDSLKKADALFSRSFPEWRWVAYCCTSWLLDRELAKCLPPSSNIVAFGNLFLPLATPNTNFRQLVERALDETGDWRTFQPRSSLQRAVLEHLRRGETFRTTSGFRLRGQAGATG